MYLAFAALGTGGIAGLGFIYHLENTGVIDNPGDFFLAIIILFGLVLLDENHQVVEFGPIDPSSASQCNLTEDEMNAYNEQLAEINIAYDEFSKRHYNDKMTQEEAIAAYNKVTTDAGLSSGVRSAFSKIAAHAFGLTKKQSK